MILSRLTAQRGTRVTLWFDDGTKMRVAARVVTDRGLYAGMDLDEASMEALRETARRADAKDQAIRIVSASGISERELRRRLVQRGQQPEDAQEAVDWLRGLGALDDAAMARRIVAQCVDKGYGPDRVRQTFRQKGIPREYWEEALETMPDMSDAIDRYLARQLSGEEPDRKELKRVIAALQRRGHGLEEIQAGLTRYRISLDDADI